MFGIYISFPIASIPWPSRMPSQSPVFRKVDGSLGIGRVYLLRGLLWGRGRSLLPLRFDERDLAGRNLWQRRHHFLVVGVDQRSGALQELLGPARRSHDQFKMIGNLFKTVFYGNSCYF